MLAQVKKLAGNDLAGRLGAWWNGREYVQAAPAEEGEAAEAVTADASEAPAQADASQPEETPDHAPESPVRLVDPKPASDRAVLNGGAVRLNALETLWGDGRVAPGSFAIDTRMLDAALELANRPGDIGFIGADGALLQAFAAQSDRKAVAVEWRAACVARLGEIVPQAEVSLAEVDRPRSFPEGALPAVISVEAFAYSDHKAGLVGRIFRALDSEGRWVFLDTTRRTKKTPPQAFASAWAEPQLATNDEIEELLMLAGFKTVRRVSVGSQVINAAKQGYANLAQVLESAVSGGLAGREGALFLQELAWEAQSWRARVRALEGGALEVNLWVADKTEQTGPLAEDLDKVVHADDAGAADALFDQS
jgi:surface antigen